MRGSTKQATKSNMEQCDWLENNLCKERDKLLQEFLTAREELKEQFDIEKKEIVINYERRNRYLRKLLEECDENINILKLNLDAEKEQNYSLKTRILELENVYMKSSKIVDSEGYFNQSYEEEATITNVNVSVDETPSKINRCKRERSSISGLKYSDKLSKTNSYDSICKSSFTSISSIQSDMDDKMSDIHKNCREEFARLFDELRQQKFIFEERLEEEKEIMQQQLEDEKMQIEKVVYKQLNLKLDKEIKKRELLVNESSHLQKTISQTIIESLLKQCDMEPQSISKKELTWKESNSDSGADVEGFQSDEDSLSPPSYQKSLHSKDFLHHVSETEDKESVINSLIGSILQDQKIKLTNEFQKQFLRERTKNKRIIESLNGEIKILRTENQILKEKTANRTSCINDISEFHTELTEKLTTLEELLVVDPDAC